MNRTGGAPGVWSETKLSRRRFLELGGASLAGAALFAAGCGQSGGSGGEARLVFSLFPDPTGTVQQLIDRFNQDNKGKIQVTYRRMPADSGQHFDQLRTEFQSGSSSIDIIGGDVIWPAQFAAQGWISDLSSRFPKSDQAAFLPAPIKANTYNGKIYGVPWYTDAGLLYYRKDLLDKAGIKNPPQTYDELKGIARQVKQEANIKYGFVFQGGEYEGGVVNGLEYIWNSGGDVLNGNKVVIDSKQAINGLGTERSFVTDGTSPQGVSQYKEQESASIFLRGDSVFMRNVPRMYALASNPNESKIAQAQIGVAELPVASSAMKSTSATGGWNMFINAKSQNQDAAWAFIKYMTASAQQKFRALKGSVLPTRVALYSDPEVRNGLAIARLGEQAIKSSRPRPISPYYSDMSLAMAKAFNASLNGRTQPGDALGKLQGDLQNILNKSS